MRKELLVYVNTGERGEEIGITSVSKNRSLVLFNTPLGKVTVVRSELIEALSAIEEFDKTNNGEIVESVTVSNVIDVEYGEQ